MDLLSVTRLCMCKGFLESIEGATSSTYVDQGFLDALIGLIIVWMAKKTQALSDHNVYINWWGEGSLPPCMIL